MFGFFSSCAVPSARKLKRKIDKMNKVRGKYIGYCEAMIGETDKFTESVLKVHDELKESIKNATMANNAFTEAQNEYNSVNNNDELEQSSNSDKVDTNRDCENSDDATCEDSDDDDIDIVFSNKDSVNNELENLDKELTDFLDNSEKYEKKNVSENDVVNDEKHPVKVTPDPAYHTRNFTGPKEKCLLKIVDIMTKKKATYQEIENVINSLYDDVKCIDKNTTICDKGKIQITHTTEVDGVDRIASIEVQSRLNIMLHGDANIKILRDLNLRCKSKPRVNTSQNVVSKIYKVDADRELLVKISIYNNKTVEIIFVNGDVMGSDKYREAYENF